MVHDPGQGGGAATARPFDVAVVGNGIIGLSAALELARGGARCALVGASEPGAGSGASAGILAASATDREGDVRILFRRSLELYPDFVARLNEFDAELSLVSGLIEVTSSDSRAALADGSRFLDQDELSGVEPALSAHQGTILHPRDAAIDSTRLMSALRKAVARNSAITSVGAGGARSIDVSRRPASVITGSGLSITANHVVLAAGAWSPLIAGLPRPLPVSPLKGQMVALNAPDVLRHAITGDHVYLVPRGNETVVGATSETAGFDLSTTPDAATSLHAAAARVCPALATTRISRQWAGLRPATADLLPIVGPDPDAPALIYATGHSRNGILLAPLTAALVRECVERRTTDAALARLSISRFPAETLG